MSFLNFRSAKRKAKKMIRRHPPLRASSSDSFASPNINETWSSPEGSPEGSTIPTTNQVDVDVPLLTSDPFVSGIRDNRMATKSRDFRAGPGRNGVGPSKPSPDDVGLEQRRSRVLSLARRVASQNHELVKRIMSEDVTRVHLRPAPPRHTPKAMLAPINIPTPSHADKVQAQRSAGISAEPHGPVKPGDFPLTDDSASIVSGVTLPGSMIANMWNVQTDLSRDYGLFRRITRLDSATLPSGDFALIGAKRAGLGNGDGDLDVLPVPPLPVVRTINDLATSTLSHQLSPIPDLSAPSSSNAVTPGLIKESRSGSPSPPPSPDLLDNFVITDRSGTRQSKYRASSAQPRSYGKIFIDPGGVRFAPQVDTLLSALSGSTQTFPETPVAFSPVFSTNIDFVHSPPFPDFSKLHRGSVTRSSRSRSSRVSQKLLIGRSVTRKASVGLRAHRKLAKSKSKLTRRFAMRFVPPVPGTKAIIPPVPLARPPSFPIPLLPPVTLVEVPASPSPQVLPPPPSPQLRLPSPSHTPRPSPPPPALPSDLPSEEHGAPAPYRLHTPCPPVEHSVARPDNLLATSALLARTSYHLDARRISTRPPLPNGPRNPYSSPSSAPYSKSHNRLGSNSSVESLSRVTLMGARDLTNSSPGSSSSSGPKFRTSPPKFKGFTMEVANWTFSSDELQAIVSRAIKHSAEPSSIRLLNAQAAFTDVPAELERLTALQNELKVRYRVQARKRDVLLRAAMACADSLGSSSSTLRARLQELAEITANLDKIADELYHARDQAAQLSRMLAVHSGSAVAMALRKLHASYLRRETVVQNLQEQVFALEAERDEAWAQAQLVARDLDDLNDTLRTRDSSLAATTRPSNRSSLVMASRVFGARVSTAGLRTSRSVRASMASQIHSGRLSYMSSVGTPASASDAIPPVPPIPRKLSSLNHIITSDLSSVHQSELSSSSDMRALAQAQADLYGYLGIDDLDMRPPPLRRSSIAVSPSAASPGARDNARRMSDSADCRTRPGSAVDRFQAYLENEPNALLATFHRLDA